MQESEPRSSGGARPAVLFRTALGEAAAKERASRTRRSDRIQAIAELTDADLTRLALEFETLLRASTDASAMAASLHAALRTLAPDAPGGEVGDA